MGAGEGKKKREILGGPAEGDQAEGGPAEGDQAEGGPAEGAWRRRFSGKVQRRGVLARGRPTSSSTTRGRGQHRYGTTFVIQHTQKIGAEKPLSGTEKPGGVQKNPFAGPQKTQGGRKTPWHGGRKNPSRGGGRKTPSWGSI